jgi:hypothetical protein
MLSFLASSTFFKYAPAKKNYLYGNMSEWAGTEINFYRQ